VNAENNVAVPLGAIVMSEEWRRGWILVLVSMIGMAIATSHIYMTGFFVGPIEKELGWSRGQISAGLLMNSVVGVLFAPFAGRLVDRFGSRRVGLPGVGIYCGAVMLLSATTHAIWTWYSSWLILAIGAVLIKPTLWAAAIARIFDRQRGLAFAVMLCGSGIGSSLLPIIVTHLIGAHGWRATYLLLGGGTALVALPLMFLFLREVGPAKTRQQRTLVREALPGLGVREALLSTRFLRIALSALIMTVTIAGLQVHFVPFVLAKGLHPASAAAAVSCVGIASIVGRLVTGMLLDRFSGPLIGAVSFGVPLISAGLWLTYDGSVTSAVVMAAALGLALGSEIDIIGYLSSRYFGLKNYGTIFGTIAGLYALGVGMGPTLAGIAYDRTRSYDIFVWCVIPAFLIAVALIGTLGRYPEFAPSGADAA
jgi:MFS family permease